MRLAIGLLLSHGFPAPSDFWESYENVMANVARGDANKVLPDHLQLTGIRRIKSTAFPPDVARNQIVREFLAGDEQYLFFMDADMTFPEDVVPRLLIHDKPVITARYHMRSAPYHPVLYVKHRTQEGPHCYAPVHFGHGVFEIERAGAGALLVRRDVFEAIQFRCGVNNWFRYQWGPPTPEKPSDFTVSEDFWFFKQAREAGFPCFADWDVECGHLQTFAINRTWNAAYLDAQLKEAATLSEDKRRIIYDSLVVCGMPDGLTLPTGETIPAYTYQPGER